MFIKAFDRLTFCPLRPLAPLGFKTVGGEPAIVLHHGNNYSIVRTETATFWIDNSAVREMKP